MADTEVEIKAVEAPVEEAVVEAPKEEPQGPAFTESDLNEHLSKLTHDDLKKLPAWNAHLSRLQNQNFIEKAKWAEERSGLENDLQSARMSAWQNYFRGMQPQQRQQVIDSDPKMAAAYAATKLWESGAANTQTRNEGNSLLTNLRKSLQTDDTWSSVINDELWQDVVNTSDPAAALKKLVDAGRENLTKADQKKLEAEVAVVKAQVQKKEPSVPAGSSGAGATGPEVDRRILDDPNSPLADKKAAYKRTYGFDYQGRG